MIHVQCLDCGEWELVGPGHPAVRFNEELQQHELHDRTQLLANIDCPAEEKTGNLAFTFVGPVGVNA